MTPTRKHADTAATFTAGTAAVAASLATLAIGVLSPSVASAQPAFPVKPIRMLIPWPPGGSNDIAGRIIAPRMGEVLGQPVIIENRAGAAGTIGADVVARSEPDGYTIMLHSVTHLSNASLYSKLPYDTVKDFTPIGMVSSQPTILVVHPSLPVKSVKDLLALARAKPKQVFYASAGNGSAPHMSMALLSSMAKVELVHVPYKGGGPAVAGVLGGEAPVMIATVPSVIGQVKAGKLRAIATASGKRLAMMPDLPTIAESGVPGYEMAPWMGIWGPAKMQRAIVEQINAALTKVQARPDIRDAFIQQGLEVAPMSVDEFTALIPREVERYARLVKLTNARVE